MKTRKLLTQKGLMENVRLERLGRKAHAHTIHNETEIVKKSRLCGCCYCGRIYESSEIVEQDLITELGDERTVWCPYCGIDAVFGDGCGVKPTSALLKRMYRMYFEA